MNIIIAYIVLVIFIIVQSYVVFQNRKRSMRNREIIEQLDERVKVLETQMNIR